MKFYTAICLFFFLSVNLFAQTVVKVQHVQPNGTAISLQVIGDQYYARTVIADGYTVYFDNTNNTYFYATLKATQDALIPTALVVGKDSPKSLQKNIQLPATVRQKIWQENYNRINAESMEFWKKSVEEARVRRQQEPLFAQSIAAKSATLTDPAPPEIGSKKGLTILVQFPDDPNTPDTDPVNYPTTQAKIERLCNEVGYHDDENTDSVRGYYRQQSNNQFDYTQLVTPIITLSHPKDYYNYSDYPTNNTTRSSWSAGRLIVSDAIQKLKDDNFDFSGLSIDTSTNSVLATNLLFAGKRSSVWNRGLWPHRGSLSPYTTSITVDGNTRYIHNFQITNTRFSAPSIGTMVHENGHLLFKFPDIYDLDDSSYGVGKHSLMSLGSRNRGGLTPAPLNLYFKDVLGWANITDLTPQEYRVATLPSTGNVGFRIRKPGSQTEYFLVENRGTGDDFASRVPDNGIIIWHVDENVDGNRNEQMTSGQHYEISLEQSDGHFDLENKTNDGDDTDLFDLATPLFTDTTMPNAHWWDGTASGIYIKVLSNPAANMQVQFGIDNALSVTTPDGGESIYNDVIYEITWAGNVTGNVKIELFKNGNFYQTIAANTANDGSYLWQLTSAISASTDYRIRITSLDDNTIFDESDADFTIAAEQFCAQGNVPTGWVSSDQGWSVTNTDASEGTHSLKSNATNDSEQATISYTGNFLAGNLTFSYKSSSEASYDFLRFFIDGVEQNINPDNPAYSTETGISGQSAWLTITFPITAGNHTFSWSYIKDYSESAFDDAAYLDGVTLPPLAPTGIEAWRIAQFGNDANNPAIAGDDADPDHDGKTNLLEYALNSDPNDPSQSGEAGKITTEATSTTFSIIYPRNISATDVTYTVEVSPYGFGLTSWNVATVTETVISVSDDTEMVKATYTMNASDPYCFLRLKVSR